MSTAASDIAVPSAAAWRSALLALGVVLLAVFIAYASTVAGMVQIWWRSGTFTHGFFIVPIVLFLIWQKRAAAASVLPQPQPWMLAPLAGVAALWWLARVLDVNAAEQFALVALIPLSVALLLGTAVARALAFPLAYLFFAVPFGEFLVPVLQDITAAITVWALNVTRIPVLWEGRYFYIPTGSFEVAEACSGVRYLIASVALGTLYAYWSYRALWRRLVFIALAVLVPILANGVRAYLIVMIAHLSDNRLAVGIDHFIYGWFFFGLVMFALFWIGNRFRDAGPAASRAQAVSAPHAAATRWPVWTGLAVAILVAAPLAQPRESASPPNLQALRLPDGYDGWRGPFPAVDGWMPVFAGASTSQRAEYQSDVRRVQVYAAWYARPTQAGELTGAMNALYNPERERRMSESTVDIEGTDGHRWSAHEILVQTPASLRVIWAWYVVDGREVSSVVGAKLREARTRLFGGDTRSGVIALAADYDTEPEQARAVLRDFIATHGAALRAAPGWAP